MLLNQVAHDRGLRTPKHLRLFPQERDMFPVALSAEGALIAPPCILFTDADFAVRALARFCFHRASSCGAGAFHRARAVRAA
jgi:hypothetical protein